MKCFCVILIIINSICECKTSGPFQYGEDNLLQTNVDNSNCTVELRKENVMVSTENNVLTINLQKAPNPDYCNITFQLDLFDGPKQIYTITTSQTSQDIDFPFIGCKIYHLSVVAIEDIAKSKTVPLTLPIAFSKEWPPPTCVVTETESDFADLECALNNEENLCDISEVIIDCETDNITNNIQIIKAIDAHTKPIKVKIGNVTANTNYNCTAKIQNSDGLLSQNSSSIRIQTSEGVPDSPLLYDITSATNTSFVIKWGSPKNIPGILRKYRVTITPTSSCYYIPENCFYFKNNTPHEYEVGPSINQYTFKDAFSCYEYEVFAEAKTIDYGPRSEVKQVLTSGGIPNKPEDVDFNIIDNTGQRFNVSVNITWKYPCPANGLINYFHLQLIGYPQIDYELGEQNYAINESVNNKTIYQTKIHNLEPAFNYTIVLKSVSTDNLESNEVILNFQTPEYIPGPPIINNVMSITQNAFTINWNEPLRKNGQIVIYYLHISNNGPNHLISTNCPTNMDTYEYQILPTNLTYRFEKGTPDYNYIITIQAATKEKNGSLSNPYNVSTNDSESEEVQNINISFINKRQEYYNGHVNVSFQIPCNTNGPFQRVTVMLIGTRANKETHNVTQSIDTFLPEYFFLLNVQAEYNYKSIVQIVTKNFIKSSVAYFISPSGVPPLGVYILQKPIQVTPTQAIVNLSKNLFDDISGDIRYYSVIIGQSSHEEAPKYGFWNGDNETWPKIFSDGNNEMEPFELTPRFWNPFLNSGKSVYSFIIGENQRFSLQPNVLYTLKVRGFTKDAYRDTPTVTFQLIEDYDATALIFGSIFGILGTAMLLVSVFILWRKRRKWAMEKESVKSIQLSPMPISIKVFTQYYNEIRNDAEKLKHEYTLLTSKSSEITSSSSIGLLVQNKKKNRYTNVIPYDHSRIILNDTDDFTTDYINASYIKGFTGNVEYIATQGPLEHTVIDFWKMIIQENVSLIVMVAQFVEQNKDKCYKYFPNNHENMELENGFTLRCCTELNFNTYIVRTIAIQDDKEQWTVAHLQFTDWPDFGCPTGTEIMLEFCQLMREYAEKTGAPIVLHCSAGVGRTGTLIALDILLQAINNNKEIDIFNTVLNLRRDRKNMVQTEKQYLYIHSCINDALETPIPARNCQRNTEPIYENVEDIKKGLNELSIKESVF